MADTNTGGVTYPCDGLTSTQHASEARQIIKQGYAKKRYKERHPLGEKTRSELELHISCSDHPDQLRDLREREKRDFFDWREYRKYTPYRGFSGEGPYLRWLAIPRFVVACETNGYRGRGRFTVRGGGDGAYQIQPPTWARWGGSKFAPTANLATPLEQAIVARRILAGQGPGAWACW